VDDRHWLVVRRCSTTQRIGLLLVWAHDAPLSNMVQAIGARWHIEEDLQVCKALGLDHTSASYVGVPHITSCCWRLSFSSASRSRPPHVSAHRVCSCARHSLTTSKPSPAGHLFWPAPTSLPCSVTGPGGGEPTNIGLGISSSPPRQSRLSLLVKHLALPGLLRGVFRELSGKHPGTFSGKTPRSFPWRSSGWLSFLLTPKRRSCPMTFSLGQASRRLGIDAKTLRRWCGCPAQPESCPMMVAKKG